MPCIGLVTIVEAALWYKFNHRFVSVTFCIMSLYLCLALLKGGIDIKVHDEAYAKVHLGMIGLNYDFFVARICFKGGAKYEINILKVRDFLQSRTKDLLKNKDYFVVFFSLLPENVSICLFRYTCSVGTLYPYIYIYKGQFGFT